MRDSEFDRPFKFGNYRYYYNTVNNKLDHEVGDALRARGLNKNLYANDLRHQYVSAVYARNLGDKKAKQLGDLNELANFYGSGKYDTELDKINNEIGRKYGLSNPDMPRNKLFELLLSEHGSNSQYAKNKLKNMGF